MYVNCPMSCAEKIKFFLLGILYFSMPILDSVDTSPELLLRPYLEATLSLAVTPTLTSAPAPLFTIFYVQHSPPNEVPTTVTATSKYLVTPSPSHLLSESLDSAATNAEAVFRDAISILKHSLETVETQENAINTDMEAEEIVPFWPTLSDNDGDTDDW
jgi:Rab proteins geranylgeranyltransferase component A